MSEWPTECYRGARREEYRTWRCEQITRLVEATSREAKRVKPRLTISAAVFGAYPACRESVGQDWLAWVKAGYLDFVCPMDYAESDLAFYAQVSNQLAQIGGRIPMYPGIGATATRSALSPDRVVGQIHQARSAGAAGFAVFNLDRATIGEIAPALGLGPGSQRAEPPHREVSRLRLSSRSAPPLPVEHAGRRCQFLAQRLRQRFEVFRLQGQAQTLGGYRLQQVDPDGRAPLGRADDVGQLHAADEPLMLALVAGGVVVVADGRLDRFGKLPSLGHALAQRGVVEPEVLVLALGQRLPGADRPQDLAELLVGVLVFQHDADVVQQARQKVVLGVGLSQPRSQKPRRRRPRPCDATARRGCSFPGCRGRGTVGSR